MIGLSFVVATVLVTASVFTGDNLLGFVGIAIVVGVSFWQLTSDLIEHRNEHDTKN